MAQLTCKNLTLGYDNRAIQEDLNFSIDAGDYLCIVGENGSGKSTLMKTLLHLQAPRWPEKKRNWLSAAADAGAERFSGIREGNCVIWMPESLWMETFL